MSDATNAARVAAVTAFTPKETVPVKLEHQILYVYPRIDPGMSIAERAHAFHVTRAALRTIPLPPDVHLETFGSYMNSSSVVDGLKFDFQEHLRESWFDMTNLTILSFHDSAGTVLNDATTDADPSILKPVQDGPVNDCRPEDVRYVRLQLVLDFRDLCTAARAGDNCTLRGSYYLELPQSSENVLNGNNVPRNLTTFHGVADLRTLSVEQIQTDILSQVFQDGPVDLVPGAFNVNQATTDELTVRASLNKAVLRLSLSTIEASVFEALCPNYTNKPQAAVESISQSRLDAEGNPVTMSIATYHTMLMQAARPFFNQREFPIDLAKHFIDGMHTDIRNVLQETYPRINEPHDRASRAQRLAIQQILLSATRAEIHVQNTQAIVSRQIGAQNFHVEGAYPSQAESTLQNYDTGRSESPTKRRRAIIICFGCKDNHLWSECKRRNEPAIQAEATKALAKWRADNAGTHGRVNRGRGRGGRGYSGGGRLSRLHRGVPNYADLNEEGKSKMKEQVFQATGGPVSDGTSAASSLSSGNQDANGGTGNPKKAVVLIADVLAVNSTREILPVPIQSNLPHIHLKVGPPESEHDPIELSCLLDSAASLTNGNFYYCSKIAKAYPHLVHSVLTSDTYAPIVMSGVVHNNGSAVTTELPVAFVFHLPYLTRDGSPTTLSVATGPHTGVNLILGLPFIESTGLAMDFVDNVADCKNLTCPPFPLFKKRAGVQIPSLQETKVNVSTPAPYDAFLADIDAIERKMISVYGCDQHVPSRRKIEQSSSAFVSDAQDDVPLLPTKGTAMRVGTAILQPEVYRADVDASEHDDGSRGSPTTSE